MPALIIDGESGSSVRSKINEDFKKSNAVFAADMSASYSAAANRTGLQAAIDAAYAHGGGLVILPPEEMNVAPGVELMGGVSIQGCAPRLDFFQNCPDLYHSQASGTRLVGAGSGSLFVGRKTPHLTGPEAGPVPTWPDTTSDGLGMMTIGHMGIRGYEIGIDVGAKNTNGLAFSSIDAIHFEDMSGWCMRIINPQHVAISRIYGYNVNRGIWMQGDNAYCAPGISYIERSFFYLTPVTSVGTDYAQRYGIFVTCDSDLVAQPFQMDGVRISNCQINMYSGVAVSDSIHVCARGQTGGRVVNTLSVVKTLFDGRATHAVELTNAPQAFIEISHHPATIDGTSTIKLTNSQRSKIVSQNINTIIDANSTSAPYFVEGAISRYTTGAAIGIGDYWANQSGGRGITSTSQYSHKVMVMDWQNNCLGPFTFNVSDPATPNTTWLTVATMGTFSDQSGTTTNISSDRSGVWKATNGSNSTWNLPTSNVCRGHEFAIVKKSGAGTVTIDAGAGRTIGYAGQTYALGNTVGASVHLVFDDRDNNWHIIGKN
jgi:hypothetical protein